MTLQHEIPSQGTLLNIYNFHNVHIPNQKYLKFYNSELSTHSDGKLMEVQEAFSTALLDCRSGNEYAENIQT